MGGGIIINRAKALTTAANDPSLYASLPTLEKTKLDALTAKDPASYVEKDLEELIKILKVAIHT